MAREKAYNLAVFNIDKDFNTLCLIDEAHVSVYFNESY